jgi:hypothetical protein
LLQACDDPVQKARYEAAAREAQRMLDEVLPSLSDAVDELLRKPNSQAALRAVRGFMDDLNRATDMMTQAASKPNASDIEALLHNMEEPIAKLMEAVQRGDLALTGKMMDVIKGNVGQQLALAEAVARNTADPAEKARLEAAVAESKKNILGQLTKLSEAARMAAVDPHNLKLMDALKRAAEKLSGACADLVKSCSVGTAEEILMNHNALAEAQQRLLDAIQAGDRKEAVSAMRAVRKLLNDQLNAAKAIARTTDDPELRAQLDAVCANAQRSIDSLMGRLASLVDTAVSDPSNTEALNSINDVFNQAQAISSKIVAACGNDLLRDSNWALQERLNEMEEGVNASDPRAAVTSLKAALAEAARQADVARMMASNMEEFDPERATRVLEFADSLSTSTPGLVAATKAALAAPGDNAAYADMHKNANKVKDISSSLVSAATLKPEDELLENAALLNADMAKLIRGLDNGEVLQADQVANIMKKISAQVKLAAVVANRSKDPKTREGLLKASQNLSKLVGAMVAACRDAMANPNDPASRNKLKGVLNDLLAANRDTFFAFAAVEDDDLQAASDDLQSQIASLQNALKEGSMTDVNTALRNVEKSAAKQAFLARAMADKVEDADRRKQIMSSIDELDRISSVIGPAVTNAKANPNNSAAQQKADALLDELRAAGHNVMLVSSSSPEERMAARALVIGAQLEELQDAVKKGNPQVANATLQSVSTGIAQQIRTARAAAVNAPPANKAVLMAAADSLEKLASAVGADVKAALAGDKAAHQQIGSDCAAIRTAMATIVANVSSSNRLPADQAIHAATSMKADIDKLATATKSNNTKAAAAAISHANRGALQQQVELIRAYAQKIDDPSQRGTVADIIEDLDKGMKEGLYPAISAAQANSNDRATTSRVTAPAESTSALLSSVIASATLSPEDRVAASALCAAQELSKVEGAVKKKSQPETTTSLASFKSALADTAKATRAAAATVRDPVQRERLFEAADALESAHNEVSAAAYDALASPNDVNAQKRFVSACDNARTNLGNVVALSTSSPEKQIAKTMVKMAAEIDNLTTSLEVNDPIRAQGALANIKDPLRQQLQFARAQAEACQDPETKKAVLAGLDKMRKAGPTLAVAAEAAIKSPADAALRDKLKAAANESKDALAEVLSSTIHPEERMLVNSSRLDSSVDKLVDVSNKEPTKIKAHLDVASSLMSEQAILARAVANNAPQQSRVAIMRDAEALEKLIPQLVRPATNVATKPSDKAEKDKLASAATAVKAANKTITGHAQAHRADRERKTQERLRKEREEKERVERERQERIQKDQDEVAAAAAKIKERTENLKVDNSVEGKLYGTAKNIAAAMDKLSKAAAAGDKRAMIEAARELAVCAQQYVEQAKAAAAKCTDPVLKEQILTSAQAAKNWSVQLKIIAAVKAASDEDSGSAKLQLVKCAKGLAKAVVLTVNAVEVSAIRSK